MPIVPEYGGPKVQQYGLPSASLGSYGSEEAFGGGAPLSNVANAAKNLFEQEKQKADQLAVLEADTKTTNEKMRLLYSQDEGALNVKGKDALGIHKPYMEKLSKFSSDVASKLSPNQAAAYNRMAASHLSDFNGQLQRHAAVEYKAFDDSTTQASILAAKNEALSDTSDPAKISFGIEKQQAIISDHAKRNGLQGDVENRLRAAAESDTYASAIKLMADNGQSILASDYYTAVKDKILPESRVAAKDYIDRKMPQDIASAMYAGIKVGSPEYFVDGKPPTGPDGSVDMIKVEKLLSDKMGGRLDDEQRQAAVKAIDAYVNHDLAQLKKANAGISQEAYSKIDEIALRGGSIDDQKRIADRLVEKLPNGQIDAHDIRTKYKYIEEAAKSDRTPEDEATKALIWDGLGDGSITNPTQISEYIGNGVSAKTAQSYIRLLKSGKAPAMKRQLDIIKADAKSKFPLSADYLGYMAGLEAQRAEQNITDPVKLQELYDSDMKDIKTGAPGMFGYFFGGQEKPAYSVQKVLHTNPALIKAVGGGQAAQMLAFDLGGPDLLVPGSEYSDAVLALKGAGKAISADSVKTFIKNNPRKK